MQVKTRYRAPQTLTCSEPCPDQVYVRIPARWSGNEAVLQALDRGSGIRMQFSISGVVVLLTVLCVISVVDDTAVEMSSNKKAKLVSCPCIFCAPEGKQVTPYIRRQHSRRYCEASYTYACELQPFENVAEATATGTVVSDTADAHAYDINAVDQELEVVDPEVQSQHGYDSDSSLSTTSAGNQELQVLEVRSFDSLATQNQH